MAKRGVNFVFMGFPIRIYSGRVSDFRIQGGGVTYPIFPLCPYMISLTGSPAIPHQGRYTRAPVVLCEAQGLKTDRKVNIYVKFVKNVKNFQKFLIFAKFSSKWQKLCRVKFTSPPPSLTPWRPTSDPLVVRPYLCI